jgi:hypothetical protein
MVTNAITKQGVVAVAGDVLVLQESFAAVQEKVGTSAKVHPVSREELEAAKKAGRAH